MPTAEPTLARPASPDSVAIAANDNAIAAVRVRALYELTKPGITAFIMLSAATGYLLAPGTLDLLRFLLTVAGTGLTAGAAATLNEYVERSYDARMRRTASRPLPSGRTTPAAALALGIALATIGLGVLLTLVGWQSALVAAASLVTYVAVYTPLKRRTIHCTLVGGIPGALPIVAGWAGRADMFDPAAWTLFAILFMWQLPHFFSLAWLYRDDYARGGFRMLTIGDATGLVTSRVSFGCAGLLAIATTLPFGVGLAGLLYGIAAPVFAVAFVIIAGRMRPDRMEKGARRLFFASLVYLPVIYTLLLIDHALG